MSLAYLRHGLLQLFKLCITHWKKSKEGGGRQKEKRTRRVKDKRRKGGRKGEGRKQKMDKEEKRNEMENEMIKVVSKSIYNFKLRDKE